MNQSGSGVNHPEVQPAPELLCHLEVGGLACERVELSAQNHQERARDRGLVASAGRGCRHAAAGGSGLALPAERAAAIVCHALHHLGPPGAGRVQPARVAAVQLRHLGSEPQPPQLVVVEEVVVGAEGGPVGHVLAESCAQQRQIRAVAAPLVLQDDRKQPIGAIPPARTRRFATIRWVPEDEGGVVEGEEGLSNCGLERGVVCDSRRAVEGRRVRQADADEKGRDDHKSRACAQQSRATCCCVFGLFWQPQCAACRVRKHVVLC
jgi:hypothetical protein